MQAAGLAQVEAARSDGRWATAYAGSATMVMPEDFLEALQKDPVAQAFYESLKRQSQFTIYHRLHSAKRPKHGRSAWWICRQSWRAAKALEICRQRGGRANASL